MEIVLASLHQYTKGRRGRDRMNVAYSVSAYHH
jgi:hypothetical protein